MSTSDDNVPVRIELIILAADGDRLTYRTVQRRLTARAEPDAVAKAAWGLPPGVPDGLLHSTSWRHEAGEVVLTYVAIPDADGSAERMPVAGWIAQGEDGMKPSPNVDLAEVAAHAARHLAFLRRTDDELAGALSAHPAVERLLARYTPAVAGEVGNGDGEPA
jgi:hypothetical protein